MKHSKDDYNSRKTFKIFLRIIPAYKANEEIEGIDDLVTVEYQGKLHKVQSYLKEIVKFLSKIKQE